MLQANESIPFRSERYRCIIEWSEANFAISDRNLNHPAKRCQFGQINQVCYLFTRTMMKIINFGLFCKWVSIYPEWDQSWSSEEWQKYANFHLKASQFLLIAAALVSSLQRKNWSRPLPQTKRSRGRKASFGKSGETWTLAAAAGTILAALWRQTLDQSLGFS